MDSNGKRQLPSPPNPPSPDPVMGELALPARKRWRDCFLAIREEINLQASFFRRLHSRPDICRRILIIQLEPMLEPMFRRVVREEFGRIIHNSNLPPRPPPNQNNQVRHKLVFLNKIKSPMFTTDKIEGENGEPIKIAIHDTYDQPIISHENPLSSAKLKIVTLDAEYWENEREIWSRYEFKNSILSDRIGKEPILTGEINFRLENGVKMINNLVVKDNSSGTRSGMFRLGVMVQIENEDLRVLEGISSPFIVMAHRGKASQKPDQLLLTHNVQCLRKIAKKRAGNLEDKNIKTVYDFLFCYHKEQAILRQIVGIKSEDDKGWKTIVKHAMECNKEFHAYNALNGINLSPMVATDNQNIISDPNAHQIQLTPPNNNYNYGNFMHKDFVGELGTGQEVSMDNHNIILDPNAHETQCAHPNNNYNYGNFMHQDFVGDFGTGQEASSNLSARTSRPHFVGSSSSQSNAYEHNIIIPGEPMVESTSNNPNLFRADSFNSSHCDALVEGFMASLSNNLNASNMNGNNVYEGPLSPHKKAKIMAIIKWVTLPARKRARLEHSVHQSGVPAA